jgi:hypothetical protein
VLYKLLFCYFENRKLLAGELLAGGGVQPAPYPPQPKKEIVKNIFTPFEIKGYDQLDTIFKLNGELKNSIGQARKNTTKGLYVKHWMNELRCEYDGGLTRQGRARRSYTPIRDTKPPISWLAGPCA